MDQATAPSNIPVGHAMKCPGMMCMLEGQLTVYSIIKCRMAKLFGYSIKKIPRISENSPWSAVNKPHKACYLTHFLRILTNVLVTLILQQYCHIQKHDFNENKLKLLAVQEADLTIFVLIQTD